jgi:hypothetical protein
MAEGDKWDTPFVIFPNPDAKVNADVPRGIRTSFEEACGSYRAGLYTASAIMCRKTIDGICAEHGIAERNLDLSLKKMLEKELIDARLYEWSDVLRVMGNVAAHDVATTIQQPDAKDAIEFTNAILDYLFSYRDRFEKFKSRRAAEKAAQGQK